MTFEIGSLSFKVQSFRALGVWVQAQGSDDRSPTRHVKVYVGWSSISGFRLSGQCGGSEFRALRLYDFKLWGLRGVK